MIIHAAICLILNEILWLISEMNGFLCIYADFLQLKVTEYV